MKIEKRSIIRNGPPPRKIHAIATMEVQFIIDPEKIRQLMIKHGLTSPNEIEPKEECQN